MRTAVTIDMHLGIASALQVSGKGPGGGLPAVDGLASLSISNSTMIVGDGDPAVRRSRGALVYGEAELRVSNSTITAGNYSTGIYTLWDTTRLGFASGARSFLDHVDVHLGNSGGRVVGDHQHGRRAH